MKRKDYKQKKYKQKSQRTPGKRLAIKISLLLTFSALILVVSYGVVLFKQANYAADRAYEELNDREKSALRDEAVEPLKDNVSILFIGIDESDKRNQGDGNSRSDALLVATLNNKEKSVKLLSIPRDSYVYVPDRGREDKITHAHAFGGTHGTIDAVEGVLDIPIDYYVKMNFNAFIDIVDALSGIDVEIPSHLDGYTELDEKDKRTIEFKEGLQHLDGKHALALARTRKLDSDVERGKRQQMILHAILKQTTSVKSITKYGDLIDAVGDNMKTNMTFGEMKSFLAYITGGLPDVEMINLVGSDGRMNGIYYWMLDEEGLEEVKTDLKTHLEVSHRTTNLTDNNSGINNNNEIADEVTFPN